MHASIVYDIQKECELALITSPLGLIDQSAKISMSSQDDLGQGRASILSIGHGP